jgi:hypothetical protein
VDERVRKRVKTDRTNWESMSSVTVQTVPLEKEQYLVNSKEFTPVKVLQRVYKPTRRRRRRPTTYEEEVNIGIGGYVVRFADGHEHCVYSPSGLLRLMKVSY